MQRNRLFPLGAVALAAALAACSDVTTPGSPVISDDQLNADVIAASGEAIANEITEMGFNEAFVGLPLSAPAFSLSGTPPGVTVNRTRTCYDANGTAQAACDNQTTASVQVTVQMDGSFGRSFTGPRGSDSMTVAVHRSRVLTISGLLGTETSRIHDGVGTSNDTTRFAGTRDSVTRSRTMTESANDSVQGITFNLPRNTNPWPVAGKIIRNVSGTVTVTSGPNQGERTFSRRIEVAFPADAQGNVVIKINDKTCTLNLTTHAVTNCSS